MATNLIIGMICAGVATGVGSKILEVIGETQIAQYVRVAGTTATGSLAVGAVLTLIGTLRKLGA